MKNKSKQSAFFNQPVLIGLFIVLAGVFLALLGSATFSNAVAQGKGKAPPQLPRAQLPSDARTAGRITGISNTQKGSAAPTDALWYNGDFNGEATGNGLANQENVVGSGEFSHVYDDFNVTDSGGWDIDSVFSNNLSSTSMTGATFEIRSGVSVGNGGTLIASGTTMTPVITPTGRSGFGFTEFMVEITGLSIHLDPGTYWLNVAPIGGATGQAFNSTTAGASCIGTPCGNNDNAFWDSPNFFGVNFVSTNDPNVCFPPNVCPDFSMGVNGTVSGGGTPTPTPGQIHLNLNQRRFQERVLVRLKWTGVTTNSVKIFRNGAPIAQVPSVPNTYTDTLTEHGSFTYKVCEPNTGNCSNEKHVIGP